ncbi:MULTISPECIES: septum formation family protein [Micromonospora]|uniref:Septum formation n=1 Tax=Micromonospora yangpuensis TaxID=683228 RepID=A0A1C6V1M3_9ACTN|nr:septum formation family protein [Micromonospora yangpuensis]GGL97887.1 hypothetical protein GCM10012279_14180 [Micromonospora yangpuensis]SCL60206.1 Septum formation [Micromonospora yangpuensis]
MRRRIGGTALGLLVGVLLTGCGAADGAADDAVRAGAAAGSPTPGDAAPFVPEAGVCHPEVETIGYRALYTVVDCAKVHKTETVHVGAFTGEDAERRTTPAVGSDPMREAFDACDAKVRTFVGGDWRDGLLTVQVVVPEPKEWEAGSRWYRCDVFALPAVDGNTARKNPDDRPVERDGSLRGILTRSSPLAHGCFTGGEDEWLAPVSCSKPHRFEYVGVWTAPDGPYEQADRDPDAVHDRCGAVVVKYTRGTPNAKLTRASGTTFRLPSPQAWERGDRGIRCFHWSADRDRTRSLKG